MAIVECFDACNDSEIKIIVGGRLVHIKYRDGSSKKGCVTNCIRAAIADDVNRTIIGFILDEEEIVVSKDIIDSIDILNY